MPADEGDKLKRNVGNQVASAREAAGHTQAELAERLGVSVTYVQRIERGVANLTLDSLAKLARGIGLPVSTLLSPKPRGRRTGRPKTRA